MIEPMIRITNNRKHHTAAIYRDMLDTYAWPGGYTLVYVDPQDQSEFMCATCASTYLPVPVVGVFWEGQTMPCVECNAPLAPSYDDTDEFPVCVEVVV